MPLTIYPRGEHITSTVPQVIFVVFILRVASKNSTKRNIHGLSVSALSMWFVEVAHVCYRSIQGADHQTVLCLVGAAGT